MPGDSLILAGRDSVLLPDTLLHTAVRHLPGSPDSGLWFFVVIAAFTAGIALPFFMLRLRKKYLQQKAHVAALAHFSIYDEWLAASNGYYQSLTPPMRQRFLERVAWFMSAKTFTCIHLPLEEKMPLLISAAAVQISFGLDKYLLDFFDTIYITEHNYRYGAYERPFEGHVSSNGIYLSWDNFLKGYEDYTDANNLGIHEMAHALAYVNFVAGDPEGQEPAFIKRFYQFSAVARPIFNAMQNGQKTLLDNYAAANYNEFWAVAVETFFEKPLPMRLEMPELYQALCKLLNQDPLLPQKLPDTTA